MRLFGYEAEYILLSHQSAEVMALDLPGVTKEFYRRMIEVITDPFKEPDQAADQLRERVERMEQHGVVMERYASFPNVAPTLTYDNDVTVHNPYYHWVYHTACANVGSSPDQLHHVGIHINYSDSRLSEDMMVAGVNALRRLNFLFILLSANSPLKNGRPSGLLSRRSHDFPNRYAVPLWEDATAFRTWIRNEEDARRIFPGKGRAWMPCVPRLQDNDWQKPINRIELRSVDSGRGLPWSVMVGCAHLLERIIASREILPSAEELRDNDLAVARDGRNAHVLFNGRAHLAEDVAVHWCRGIPELEEVLACGSPAELALRSLA